MIYIRRNNEVIDVVSIQHFQGAEVHDELNTEDEYDVLRNPQDYEVIDGNIVKIYNQINL